MGPDSRRTARYESFQDLVDAYGAFLAVLADETPDAVDMSWIGAEEPGEGVGTRFMHEAKHYADQTGKRLIASAVETPAFFASLGFMQPGPDRTWIYDPGRMSKQGVSGPGDQWPNELPSTPQEWHEFDPGEQVESGYGNCPRCHQRALNLGGICTQCGYHIGGEGAIYNAPTGPTNVEHEDWNADAYTPRWGSNAPLRHDPNLHPGSSGGDTKCPTCGDPLKGEHDTFCPRCQWSEHDVNLDADPLSNPPDPTQDMHRGIQAGFASTIPSHRWSGKWMVAVEDSP